MKLYVVDSWLWQGSAMQQHMRTLFFAEMACSIHRYKELHLYYVWLCLPHNSVLHVLAISWLWLLIFWWHRYWLGLMIVTVATLSVQTSHLAYSYWKMEVLPLCSNYWQLFLLCDLESITKISSLAQKIFYYWHIHVRFVCLCWM